MVKKYELHQESHIVYAKPTSLLPSQQLLQWLKDSSQQWRQHGRGQSGQWTSRQRGRQSLWSLWALRAVKFLTLGPCLLQVMFPQEANTQPSILLLIFLQSDGQLCRWTPEATKGPSERRACILSGKV